MKGKYYYIWLLLLSISCKEVYRPDVISAATSYLVVEGVLNVNGPTDVHLTRTSQLDSVKIRPELNAQVTVEGKDNSVKTLTAAGSGHYSSAGLNLVLGNEYRLHIRLTSGKEYMSEYVVARATPSIDTIGHTRTDDVMKFFISTHDPSGNTRYYRWDYEETWEIKSFYYSRFIYVVSADSVRARTAAEDVSRGWKSFSSTSILLGSSARLQNDIISEAPLISILRGDDKLSVRYSVLVRQYAMDKAGYDFYDLMKRNTESLGTIFDAQPSEIKGNIKSVSDPAEPVIGYVSASTISEKRIFVDNAELPFSWRYIEDCPYYTVAKNKDSIHMYFRTDTYAPFDAAYSPITGEIVGYLSSFAPCVDCTRRGATTVKPSFW